MAPQPLPADFLSKPATNITKTHVDWQAAKLPEYEGSYAVVLDNVLSESECQQLVSAAEHSAAGVWEPALINTGNFTQVLYTDVRNNSRIMWDDAGVAARLWDRVKLVVPELAAVRNNALVAGNGPVRRGEIWEFSCLNERLRFLQYGPGEYFKPHCDGAFERRDKSERSMYTLHLYLNERTEANPMQGGATSFHAITGFDKVMPDYDVVPKVGRVLIFQHRNLLHSGQEVEKGIKLTLRTDLMFRKSEEYVPEEERPKFTMGSQPKRQFLSRT